MSPPRSSPWLSKTIFFCEDVLLPVELTSFDAVLDGRSAELRWETASETNNAGFYVEHRFETDPEGAFETMGFVEGNGTTILARRYSYRVENLQPGSHIFRLKQVDFDGTFEYHPSVEVVVELPELIYIEPVYPNPFNPEATLHFAVRQRQEVRVELFDLLGHRVQEMYRGIPEVGVTQTVRIDGSLLRSGTYVVRVLGVGISESQIVTLIK